MLKRIITGVILILLVIAAILYLPHWAFATLSGLILLYGAYEWTTITQIQDMWQTLFFMIFVIISFLLGGLLPHHVALGVGMIWWIWATYKLSHLKEAPRTLKNTFLASKWNALFVFAPCWIGLNLLKLEGGAPWVIAALVIVWVSDTCAYFVGKSLGKTPLAAKISPKKTKEGAIAALIASLIAGTILGWVLSLSGLSIIIFLVLCMITSGATIIGDLYESFLKRIANLKDSGHLLPGHGGLLDRIDGMLAAVPFFTLGVIIFKLI